jgi:crossover junction endodeoxyribonuclease RuvC
MKLVSLGFRGVNLRRVLNPFEVCDSGGMGHMIRILGVDPGLRHTGWGIIDMDGPRLSWVAHGVIDPDPKADLADRLGMLCEGLRAVIHEHDPMEAAVEETFVNINPKSTLLLGQARGAALATLAAAAKLKVARSCGHQGQAIRRRHRARPTRRRSPSWSAACCRSAGDVTADAADALAVAICGAHHRPSRAIRGSRHDRPPARNHRRCRRRGRR